MFFHRTSYQLNQQKTIYSPAPSQSLSKKTGKAPVLPARVRCRISLLFHRKTQQSVTSNDLQTHRKERVLFPIRSRAGKRTSFSGSFSGNVPGWFSRTAAGAALTVEAALELPVFFVLIAIILQYACVMRTAAQYSGSLTTAAQEMAIAAYKEEYGDANKIIRAALSDAWASSQVISTAADQDAVRNASFLNSTYLKDDDFIRLVLSYQPKPKFSLIQLPFTFFVQKAVVRGWVGKDGNSGRGAKEEKEEDPSHRKVYVTEHGSVYHTNPGCSHLKVTIIPVTKDQLRSARNTSGSKYHRCPYCSGHSTGKFYVDPYGTCYHSSVDCPSLKRTVHELELDECGHMHECKDCRKARGEA